MKQLIENLRQFRSIVVVGPQRSGTRIGTKILAHELGYKYVDELDFDCEDREKLIAEIMSPVPKVIQAPAMTHYATAISFPYAAWVMMCRDIVDVLASQKAMGWPWDEHEQVKYVSRGPNSTGTKYIWWLSNRHSITNAFELMYSDLEGHPLFVPKEKRKHFKWDQTEV